MSAHPAIVPTSMHLSSDVRVLSNISVQSAFVRALLDELERLAPASSADVVSEQLVEDLARLGCRCLEVASALTSVVDAKRCCG